MAERTRPRRVIRATSGTARGAAGGGGGTMKPTLDISTINTQIESFFRRRPWTDQQVNLYRMLHKTLLDHAEELKTYQRSIKDRGKLVGLLNSRPWFQHSKSKQPFEAMVNSMKVVMHEYKDSTLKLTLEFPKHGGFYFKVKCKVTKKRQQLYIYLENSVGEARAHLAALDTKQRHDSVDSLPQFDEMMPIIPRSLVKADKLDLVKFWAELAMYYDHDDMVASTPISQQSEYSLWGLANLG